MSGVCSTGVVVRVGAVVRVVWSGMGALVVGEIGGRVVVSAQPERSVRRLVVTGAVLEATAVTLGLAGLVLWTFAVTSRTQQRVARMKIPLAELALRHWARAGAAASAGIGAWRDTPVGPRTDGVRLERETPRP